MPLVHLSAVLPLRRPRRVSRWAAPRRWSPVLRRRNVSAHGLARPNGLTPQEAHGISFWSPPLLGLKPSRQRQHRLRCSVPRRKPAQGEVSAGYRRTPRECRARFRARCYERRRSRELETTEPPPGNCPQTHDPLEIKPGSSMKPLPGTYRRSTPASCRPSAKLRTREAASRRTREAASRRASSTSNLLRSCTTRCRKSDATLTHRMLLSRRDAGYERLRPVCRLAEVYMCCSALDDSSPSNPRVDLSKRLGSRG